MTRYFVMHVIGYAANLLIIYVGYDVLAFPHQLVQLFAMFFLAGMFFLVSKFLIFSSKES